MDNYLLAPCLPYSPVDLEERQTGRKRKERGENNKRHWIIQLELWWWGHDRGGLSVRRIIGVLLLSVEILPHTRRWMEGENTGRDRKDCWDTKKLQLWQNICLSTTTTQTPNYSINCCPRSTFGCLKDTRFGQASMGGFLNTHSLSLLSSLMH